MADSSSAPPCSSSSSCSSSPSLIPLVSVVVPVYNVCSSLSSMIHFCESLNSIVSQSYRNFELILVDDGSTDQTQSLIQQYAKWANNKMRTMKNCNSKVVEEKGLDRLNFECKNDKDRAREGEGAHEGEGEGEGEGGIEGEAEDDRSLQFFHEYPSISSFFPLCTLPLLHPIVVHYFDSHCGISTALNTAIALSRGRYIARMDADDISHTDRLEKQIQFMQQQSTSDRAEQDGAAILMIGSAVEVFRQTDPQLKPTKLQFPESATPLSSDSISSVGPSHSAPSSESSSPSLSSRVIVLPVRPLLVSWSMHFYCSIAHPSVLGLRSWFLSHPYSTAAHSSHCEDYELWLRMMRSRWETEERKSKLETQQKTEDQTTNGKHQEERTSSKSNVGGGSSWLSFANLAEVLVRLRKVRRQNAETSSMSGNVSSVHSLEQRNNTIRVLQHHLRRLIQMNRLDSQPILAMKRLLQSSPELASQISGTSSFTSARLLSEMDVRALQNPGLLTQFLSSNHQHRHHPHENQHRDQHQNQHQHQHQHQNQPQDQQGENNQLIYDAHDKGRVDSGEPSEVKGTAFDCAPTPADIFTSFATAFVLIQQLEQLHKSVFQAQWTIQKQKQKQLQHQPQPQQQHQERQPQQQQQQQRQQAGQNKEINEQTQASSNASVDCALNGFASLPSSVSHSILSSLTSAPPALTRTDCISAIAPSLANSDLVCLSSDATSLVDDCTNRMAELVFLSQQLANDHSLSTIMQNQIAHMWRQVLVRSPKRLMQQIIS